MSLVKEAPKKATRHRCDTPDARKLTEGSVWCCEGCHRISTVINDSGMWSDDFNMWQLETEKKRRRRWKRGVVYAEELR